jgi:hypothetical protein
LPVVTQAIGRDESDATSMARARAAQLEVAGADAPPPAFSCAQPTASFPRYPGVEAFLWGPQQIATFRCL